MRSAHGTHASIDTPLTMSDSASAGSHLVVLGIPATHARINMAIVSVGNIPATFRISAVTSSGASIGRPILRGVEEDGVWVVYDLESELPAAIDEGAMIRVTVIAGTGVAYASVVQPNGDVLNIPGVPSQ